MKLWSQLNGTRMLFGSSATSATKIRKTPSSKKRKRFLQSSIQLTSTRRWVQHGMCIAALVWISTGLLVWKPSGVTQIPLRQGDDSKKQSIAIPQASNQNGVRGIVYVHVGKTGGEWIKAQLKMVCKTRRNKNIRAVCLQQKYPTYLSKLTVGYIHTSTMYIDSDVQKPRQTIPRTKSIRDASGAFSHYLFSLRHPLRRLMSWYTYNHPKSCDEREPHSPSCKTSTWKTSFYKCFPTLQDLADHIQPAARMNMQGNDCTETFWNGWHARGDNMEPKDSNHLHWNYQVCAEAFFDLFLSFGFYLVYISLTLVRFPLPSTTGTKQWFRHQTRSCWSFV